MLAASIFPFPELFNEGFCLDVIAAPHSSLGIELENSMGLDRSPARPIFFPRIDDTHCNRIHASLTAIHDEKNSRQAWIGALATAILLKYCSNGIKNQTINRSIIDVVTTRIKIIFNGLKTIYCFVFYSFSYINACIAVYYYEISSVFQQHDENHTRNPGLSTALLSMYCPWEN